MQRELGRERTGEKGRMSRARGELEGRERRGTERGRRRDIKNRTELGIGGRGGREKVKRRRQEVKEEKRKETKELK